MVSWRTLPRWVRWAGEIGVGLWAAGLAGAVLGFAAPSGAPWLVRASAAAVAAGALAIAVAALARRGGVS